MLQCVWRPPLISVWICRCSTWTYLGWVCSWLNLPASNRLPFFQCDYPQEAQREADFARAATSWDPLLHACTGSTIACTRQPLALSPSNLWICFCRAWFCRYWDGTNTKPNSMPSGCCNNPPHKYRCKAASSYCSPQMGCVSYLPSNGSEGSPAWVRWVASQYGAARTSSFWRSRVLPQAL